MKSRHPIASIAPFVSQIWASDGSPRHGPQVFCERTLPTGRAHLVLRLGSEPLRLIEHDGENLLGNAVIGGVRMNAYSKDVSRTVPTVGAVLEAGAISALFGVSASELAGRHTPLDTLWGRSADRLCDQLASLPDLASRLDCLEKFLAARPPTVRGVHPGVAHALATARVNENRASHLAERAGLGPRRFAQVFRDAIGISPKSWLRLKRFQSALAYASDTRIDWTNLAYDRGYSDQSHFAREFREFAGITPREYRRLAPAAKNHVPETSQHAQGPISSRHG